MNPLPASLDDHRVHARHPAGVLIGRVRYSPAKSLWFSGMALAALIGGALTFSWAALGVYLGATATVLLLGHSLGSHRKLIHDSFSCPKWLEYLLVYLGVQVGLDGPIGLLRQHELRDYAQRLPDCHPYLRHGRGFWRDGWWQLHCELELAEPPAIGIEARIADDRFYRFLERTWRLQQLPPALLLYALGGWSFVVWGTCARVATGVLGHWLIGHLAHNRGSAHYEVRAAAVQGRNVAFTSLLTMGECWHNNHHAFPGSARLGLFAGEWDPGWWVLMLLRKAGLAADFRIPERLPARPELVALDGAGAGVLRAQALPTLHGRRIPTRLSAIAALCTAGPDEAPGPRLVGPAAVIGRRAMRRLVGARTPFDEDGAAQRLTLSVGPTRLQGLPALCVAFARRNALCAAVGLALAPAAVAFENLRESLDAAG